MRDWLYHMVKDILNLLALFISTVIPFTVLIIHVHVRWKLYLLNIVQGSIIYSNASFFDLIVCFIVRVM